MLAARSRLVSLWISQVARALAGSCLRVSIVLHVSQHGLDGSRVWSVSLPFYLAPFILLAPVNGALSNRFPRRWVLLGSAAFCLCMTALWGVIAGGQGEIWLWCIGLGLVGAGQAVYSSARYAILPAAAQDTRWPLNRVMGWMETGDALAVVVGSLIAWSVHDLSWQQLMAGLGWESTPASRIGHADFPVAVAATLAFNLVALLGALPVHFPSEARRPEPLVQAIASFFRDSKVLGKDRVASGSLLSQAYFLGVIAAGSGAGLELTVILGLAVGCLLATLQGHPRRMLGLVAPAALGLVGTLLWAGSGSNLLWAYLLVGLMGGLILVPLRTMVQLTIPADLRGNGMALMNAVNAFSILAPALLLSEVTWFGITTQAAYYGLVAIGAAAGAVVAWRVLLRETIEQCCEILLWPMYRIRVRGPGRLQLPLHGPLLVIANHTAWFDPLWLAKVLPRQLTAMMTSKFFDLPVLHWLMRNVAGAIRVPVAGFRREAPELHEAIAVLDRGGCVLIFPEGSMKRHPEQSLRHFGQGVWRILRQRPNTPVVVCWIEGGWGSYTSYCGGPPTVNKHLDFWRRIEIAVETPQILDPALLADQHATRDYLMRACVNARRYLGLQPLPLQPATTGQLHKDVPYEHEER